MEEGTGNLIKTSQRLRLDLSPIIPRLPSRSLPLLLSVGCVSFPLCPRVSRFPAGRCPYVGSFGGGRGGCRCAGGRRHVVRRAGGGAGRRSVFGGRARRRKQDQLRRPLSMFLYLSPRQVASGKLVDGGLPRQESVPLSRWRQQFHRNKNAPAPCGIALH